MRKFKDVMKIKNSKKDFKGVEKNLRLSENNLINNTEKLIYNFGGSL